jgi:ribosomal protein S18 acetylase RimI-like enzyme
MIGESSVRIPDARLPISRRLARLAPRQRLWHEGPVQTPCSIRRARPDDAPALADVKISSWRATYPGMSPDAVLDALRPDVEAQAWRKRISSREDHVFVAERGGALLGYAVSGPSGDGSAPGELHSLYVAPSALGTGAGRALLEAAMSDLVSRGLGEAVLWVLAKNARARRFYEREGFATDGGQKECETLLAPAVRYRKRLA